MDPSKNRVMSWIMWKSAVCACVCVSDMPPHPTQTHCSSVTAVCDIQLQPPPAGPLTLIQAHQIMIRCRYIYTCSIYCHSAPQIPHPLPRSPFLFDKLPSWKCRCWISWLCGGCATSRTLWSWIVGWVSVTGWLSVRCWPSPAQLRLLQIKRWGGGGVGGGSLRATMIHIKAA